NAEGCHQGLAALFVGAEAALRKMVGAAGIEPATLGLEIRCSIRLSYAPALINTGEEAHCRNLRSLIAMPAVRIAHPTRPLPVGPSRARINLAWRSMRCSRDVIRLP